MFQLCEIVKVSGRLPLITDKSPHMTDFYNTGGSRRKDPYQKLIRQDVVDPL